MIRASKPSPIEARHREVTLKTFTLAAIAALCFCTSGCAIYDGRPAVKTVEVEDQAKLKSASHWRVMADDVATHIDLSVRAANVLDPMVVVAEQPGSQFSKVFASQLRAGLLQRRLPVADRAALEVSFVVENVRHATFSHRYRPGSITALTGGVLVVRDAVLYGSNPVLATMGVAIALDAIATQNEISNRPLTEVVLSTSVRRGGTYVAQRTDVYYIDEADARLFAEPAPPPPPAPDTSRQFRVVGAR